MEGKLLLPQGSVIPSGRRLLVEGNQKSKLMKAGLRGDAGTSACVDGSTLAAFGGNGAEVDYRGISFVGTLRRDRWLSVQFAISVLTVVGAGITAYITYIKATAPDAGSFASNSAVIALAIAGVLSVLKFAKEYRDL